jgi:hypothetical protein
MGVSALGTRLLALGRHELVLDRWTVVGNAGVPGMDLDRTAVDLGR